jgi:hypothetical protein
MPAFLGIAPLFWYIVSGATLVVFGMMIGILLTGLGRAAAKPAPRWTPPPSGHPLGHVPAWLIEDIKPHPLDSTQSWVPPTDDDGVA